MQYYECKIQDIGSRNGVHFLRLFTEPYGQFIPHVKYTHETQCTKS